MFYLHLESEFDQVINEINSKQNQTSCFGGWYLRFVPSFFFILYFFISFFLNKKAESCSLFSKLFNIKKLEDVSNLEIDRFLRYLINNAYTNLNIQNGKILKK
jgi:hypothetical protein